MPGTILELVLGNVAVAAALAAVALAVGRRRGRPALAHALWLLVLLKLVTPSLVTVTVPCLPVAAAGADDQRPAPPPPSPAKTASSVGVVRAARVITALAEAHASPGLLPGPAGQDGAAVAPASILGNWFRWDVGLLAIWAAGSAIAAAVAVRRTRRFIRLLQFALPPRPGLEEDVAELATRMGLRAPPRVRVLPGGVPPFVWAVGRPTIYFPVSLLERTSAEGRRTLLAHELAHLRRRDHWVRWLESVVLAVYWWCPLAWLARRELRRLEEEACDAEVVDVLPECAHAYATAVLETIDFLAGARRVPTLASGIGDSGSLRGRLVLILEGRRACRPGPRSRVAFAALAIGLLLAGPRAGRLAASVAPGNVHARAGNAGVASIAPPVAKPAEEPAVQGFGYLPDADRFLEPTALAGSPCAAAALSPDGRLLALASGARVVVWDVETRTALFALAGHTDAVNAVAFAPDGSRMATVSNDGTARLWDVASRRELATLTGHNQWVLALAFSPDGKTLATGGYDKLVRLWDVASGNRLATLAGHGGGLRALAFSPDGRALASGAADNTVRLWDVNRAVVLRTVCKHEAAVRAVAFSPDGRRLVSASEDRTVRFWDANDGREVPGAVPLPDGGVALCFVRGGRSLVAGTAAGHLLDIDPASGQIRSFIGVAPGDPTGRPAHADAVVGVAEATPDGRLYTVSRDGTVSARAPAGALQRPALEYLPGGAVTAVALSGDGKTLATGGRDGVVHLWDAATAVEKRTLAGHQGGVTALLFAGNERLVSAGTDECVRVWDAASGRAVRTIVESSDDLRVAVSPDGCTLAVSGPKTSGIALWDAEAGELVRRFGALAGGATALAFLPTGDRLAAGYADGMIRLWDPATGEEVQRGPAGTGQVDGIAVGSGDTAPAAVVVNRPGPAGAAAGQGPACEVVFWDPRTGSVREGSRPLAHPGPVVAVTFTPDARLVLTAGRDGNLYVWDCGAGKVTGTVRAHAEAVRGVAVMPDGKAAISAGDRAGRRWPMPPAVERTPSPAVREASP